MSTGKETQWKSTWVILGVLQGVPSELRLTGLARVRPGKKGKRATQWREGMRLAAGLSCQLLP